jgi:hypothetical protein
MYYCRCYTCEDTWTFEGFAGAQEEFNKHAVHQHEVEIQKMNGKITREIDHDDPEVINTSDERAASGR